MPKKRDIPSDEKAKIILDAVEDRLAENPVLIDVRGKTVITDFFLICTGTSEPHMRAITESVLERADEDNLGKPRVEGRAVGEWVLMDFGDVVLHIMNAETRERYKLEEFWTTPQPHGALPPTPNSVSGDEDIDAAPGRTDRADDRFVGHSRRVYRSRAVRPSCGGCRMPPGQGS